MKHETTTFNTKKMLAETLISLLHKKPLSKITVSEIVNICQINRKTFYYHFTDIYDLLEWHLSQEMSRAMDVLQPYTDFTATFNFSMDYFDRNTYLQNCVDDPIGRDKIMQFLTKKIYPATLDMINVLEQRYNKCLDDDYKAFLSKLITNITALSLIDTINNPNNIDRDKMLLYLSDIFQTSVDGFFQKL